MSEIVRLENDVGLAVLLASGVSCVEAAAQVGLNERTVRRKLAEPEFRRLMHEVRGELLTRALGVLTDNMTKAAAALAALIDDADTGIKLKAARTLLYLGVRVHDAVEIAERVQAIEDELAQKREEAAP